jgi:hypothetical protein
MITKRTPIRPPGGRKRISAAAIAAFRQMEQLALQCECPPIDWGGKYWQRPPACASCDRWWDQHSILHRELQLEPWYWPVYQHPDAGPPYPEGSSAAKHWKPDLEGQARYRLLKAAAEAAEATPA